MDDKEQDDNYLTIVKEQLLKREEKLHEIDKAIAKKKFEIEEGGSSKKIISGDSAFIKASNSYLAKLRKELGELDKKRAEYLKEVEMARERLKATQLEE